ncbi:MAG: cytochrome c oxidase subunit 3 [Methylotenera sp.]|uniref:cytochrome c oxidase subunit 3 n=1 Tax=Methylotenera sp. TaxID=2051956 RepID=UPI00271E24F3|nr:cytochrome c oxidase subunit 3 [Methylotenera sp.]MDO9393288.1 cytochrome c oxidase subunit 3 [Methylotenera sp.]MDP1523051.1 cytochrome c oxidase subunit 3 [Methylotenera sp.]MDP2230516.1 cytochrome c oxidase subunit 3 [Methylotenera sp.]MDP3140307.1 cytochrome c oxidase subunit 3 [Methylotenera sp.]MDP3819289.1 cytochrome c oxidase subunit 3 [Methylotenera sp.]
MATHSNNQYYVPHGSIYPAIISIGLLSLASGFVFSIANNQSADLAYLQTPGKWMMVFGALLILSMVFKWMGSVITESLTGSYKSWEDKSFRIGMIVFICSEIAFFAAFFGALFYMRVLSVPELASFDPLFTPYKDFLGTWPSIGPGGAVLGAEYVPDPKFMAMGWSGLPAINTALLLSSGATITWAHWALIKNNRKQLILGMALTVALGVTFLICQGLEYHHAYTEMGLTLGSGAYGASFFMLTGFHGFHVLLGTLMLIVILLRCIKGHFTPEHHFGFEGVAWYWHFVDVVWLGLFIFVYIL